VVVFGIDPARAGKSPSQGGEVLRDIGGNFQTSEEAGHDTNDESLPMLT
jgi:hypothetical protein